MTLLAVFGVVAFVVYLVRDATCPKCGHHVIRHRKETLPDGIGIRHTFTCNHCQHTWTRG